MTKDMKYVYNVYLEKSFSKAAKKLLVSQPALSTTIKKVEARLKINIFDRSSKPIQLTSAGKYYIKSVEKIIEIEKDMKTYFAAINNDKKSTINIGSSAFFCGLVLPSIIDKFKEKYPDYHVNLLETNVGELTKCLESEVINLSLGVEILDPKSFIGEICYEEHIVLAVPSFYEINNQLEDYRLTFEDIRSKEYLDPKYPSVSMKHFKEESFLLLRKGNDLYSRALKICENAGFEPQVDMYLDQLLTSYHVAYSGKGIAFIRGDITQHVEPTEKLAFYKIDDENARRNIMLHYKDTGELSEITKEFIAFFRTFIEGQKVFNR